MHRTETYTLTRPVRISYPHLFKVDNNGRHSCVFILDPVEHKHDIENIQKLLRECINADFAQFPDEKKRQMLAKPIKNGNLKTGQDGAVFDGYADKVYFNTAGTKVPFCFKFETLPGEKRPTPVLLPQDEKLDEIFYPGCFVGLTVNAYSWNHKSGGPGVSVGLSKMIFLRDGDRLGSGGGMGNAEEDFSQFADAYAGADDPANYEDRGATTDPSSTSAGAPIDGTTNW